MRLGLIGKAIMNSSSPYLQTRLGELTGIDVVYDLVDANEVITASVEEQVRDLINQGYRGINVTHPFKEEAAQLSTHRSERVRTIGSANTLIFEASDIRAENTDCSGFVKGFRATFGARAPGQVLLLGAGGVGKAVAFALGQLGAEEVVVLDPDQDKSRLLADELKVAGFHASYITDDALDDTVARCHGLVNCSPIGHENSPGCPVPKASIDSKHWVFDAVYVPVRTEFINAALAAGAAVMSGISLFVFQGIDAFKLFCEKPEARQFVSNQEDRLFAYYKQELLQEKEQ